jgi:uncharacterized membrane-anchored protein
MSSSSTSNVANFFYDTPLDVIAQQLIQNGVILCDDLDDDWLNQDMESYKRYIREEALAAAQKYSVELSNKRVKMAEERAEAAILDAEQRVKATMVEAEERVKASMKQSEDRVKAIINAYSTKYSNSSELAASYKRRYDSIF